MHRESYATDSGVVQGRHKEGSLSGMHRESYATDSGHIQGRYKEDAYFQACIVKAIPPTLDAFKGDIKRAHFQACIGKAMPLDLEAFKGDIKRAHFQACIGKAIPPTLEFKGDALSGMHSESYATDSGGIQGRH